MSQIRTWRVVFACTLVAHLCSQTVSAAIINGDFGTLDLTGWSTSLQTGSSAGATTLFSVDTETGIVTETPMGYVLSHPLLGASSSGSLFQDFGALGGDFLRFDYHATKVIETGIGSASISVTGPGLNYVLSSAFDESDYWTSIYVYLPNDGTYRIQADVSATSPQIFVRQTVQINLTDVQVVPEFGSLVLGGFGAVLLFALRGHKRRET